MEVLPESAQLPPAGPPVMPAAATCFLGPVSKSPQLPWNQASLPFTEAEHPHAMQQNQSHNRDRDRDRDRDRERAGDARDRPTSFFTIVNPVTMYAALVLYLLIVLMT